MGTGSAFPMTGADENFAVPLAFLAMKFVNRHWLKVTGPVEISSGSRIGVRRHVAALKARTCPRSPNSWRQFFAMRLVVAIPAGQGGVIGVGEKELQRRRFNVAIAKNHIGTALMTGISPFCAAPKICDFVSPCEKPDSIFDHAIASYKSISDCHRVAWTGNL